VRQPTEEIACIFDRDQISGNRTGCFPSPGRDFMLLAFARPEMTKRQNLGGFKHR
jgi:hypothetical protein